MSALLCACGGGGGSSPAPAVVAQTQTPAPTATLPAAASASVTAGAVPVTTTFGPVSGSYSGSVTLAAATAGSGPVGIAFQTSDTGATLASSARLPKAIGGSDLAPFVYVLVTPTASVTFATFPSFTFALPPGFALPSGANLYLGYDAGNAAGNWSTLAGPATIGNGSVSFTGVSGPVTFTAGVTYGFALFSTAQALATPSPKPSPTASPTASASASPSPSPSPAATSTVAASGAFECPTSGAASASFARVAGANADTRRPVMGRNVQDAPASTATLAVSYDSAAAASGMSEIEANERRLGLSLITTYTFPHAHTTMRLVSVPAAAASQLEASLRSLSGVRSVAVTGERRHRMTSSAYYTNDPYFQGFSPNFEQLPYAESATVPGQWDMHAIGLEHAYGYSQSGATYTATANALGSSAIKIAIIDTGEDASHPELSGKIMYQHCYITAGNRQSRGTFSTDEDGHGTDVSGIAAAASGNGLGFTGSGGNASIYAYRIFPTPDDNCASDSSNDAQCSADTADIASAITDAIAQNVNVISMSLGGGGCTNGVDQDATEQAAVAEALSQNIIVVAAAGNSGRVDVTAPACINGVIAVGATSLADGSTTGTSGFYTSAAASTATSSNIVEYVASYSQYGSPGSSYHSSSAWGIVAPGGDPSNAESSGTPDDLHWIENIWTSTPYMSSPSDLNFTGNCASDLGTTSAADCRTLIAGTSMATPHVAGAVALILSVNSSYQSPSGMKTLLCSTADELNDTHEGCGRLNLYRAMATAIGDTARP